MKYMMKTLLDQFVEHLGTLRNFYDAHTLELWPGFFTVAVDEREGGLIMILTWLWILAPGPVQLIESFFEESRRSTSHLGVFHQRSPGLARLRAP